LRKAFLTEHIRYFEYLKRRSRFGQLYRHFWLYPRLCSYLNGEALDIGCGIGDFLSYRKNTVGVDINEEVVNWCLYQGHLVDLMQADLLPYRSSRFDSVIMDNVLEHIGNPQPILSEAHRVLKNDGIIVVGVPGALGFSKDPDHKVFYSDEKLVETMISAGFSVLKIFSMPLGFKSLSTTISQYCVYGVFHRLGKDNESPIHSYSVVN